MEPHVYHLKRATQVIYCGGAFFLMGTALQFGIRHGAWLMTWLFCIPGIYICWWAISSRCTLTDTDISTESPFVNQSAELHDIEAWRTDSGGRGGPVWVLQLKDGGGFLNINQNFNVDDAFFDFLDKLKNVDDLEISITPR
jgi:hypothetical protein